MNMQNISGKNVVITGSGSGIGRNLAIQLAEQGCGLALSDIDEKGLQETLTLLPATNQRVRTDRLDVTDKYAFKDYAQSVLADFAKVDIVINNAGVAASADVKDNDYDIYQWVFDINIWGVLYGTKEFLPHMLANKQGKIVNISSIFGIISSSTFSAYNMSKFAVRGLNEALWSELEGTGVSCLSVHPGGIKTNLVKHGRSAGDSGNKIMGNFEKMFDTSAEECARQIIQGIRKDKRRILVGIDARFFNLVQRIAPTNYYKLLNKLMNWKIS
jgi:short-subunit dehydrogenase